MSLLLNKMETKYKGKLGTSDIVRVRLSISEINWHRIRVYLRIFIVIQALVIFFIDIPSIRAALSENISTGLSTKEPLWLPLCFLALHIGLFFLWVLGLTYSRKILQETKHLLSKLTSDNFDLNLAIISARRHDSKLVLILGVGLLLLGMISGLDQLRSGDITAFTMTIVIGAAFLCLRPPLNFMIMTPSFIALICGVLLFQTQHNLRVSHLTNGVVLYIAVLTLTNILYKSQYQQVADARLLARSNKLLDELSSYDQLTGLANRRLFRTIFEREISRLKREGGYAFLVVADIDLFKEINDYHGHPAGDAVICNHGKILQMGIRKTDFVARWGGEEFVLLIMGGSTNSVLEIVERLRETIARTPTNWQDQEIICTESFGLTEVNISDPDAFDNAYHRADQALYRAKEHGRNRVCVEYCL